MPKLDNQKREVDTNKVAPAVFKCAEQAQGQGYNYFSVGLKGVCYSGPEAGETFFKKGPAPAKKKCTKDGVGKNGAAAVYTFGKPILTGQRGHIFKNFIFFFIFFLFLIKMCS